MNAWKVRSMGVFTKGNPITAFHLFGTRSILANAWGVYEIQSNAKLQLITPFLSKYKFDVRDRFMFDQQFFVIIRRDLPIRSSGSTTVTIFVYDLQNNRWKTIHPKALLHDTAEHTFYDNAMSLFKSFVFFFSLLFKLL